MTAASVSWDNITCFKVVLYIVKGTFLQLGIFLLTNSNSFLSQTTSLRETVLSNKIFMDVAQYDKEFLIHGSGSTCKSLLTKMSVSVDLSLAYLSTPPLGDSI